jgi:hypothetical protein
VDRQGKPYEDLVKAVTETNAKVDALHASSGTWKLKPSLSRLPSQDVMARGSVLKGLHFRPSMDGLPSDTGVKAKAAWEPGTLRFDVDVKNGLRTVDLRQIRWGIEWFWQTDAVELMLRPVEADRPLGAPEPPSATTLDEASLKVWAVPDGEGKDKPYVGSWRRHARQQGLQTGVEVEQHPYPGGYGLTFKVPARLLKTDAFKAGQAWRFNLLVEDCRQVSEVYWSAHQGDGTTEKPETWGTLTLRP